MIGSKDTINRITTLGIFAHANAGKTTLTEQLLQRTGVIKRIGRVDKGDTVTDFLEVEKNRGITVKSTYVTFTLGDMNVQLIDTPGHVDFSGEVIRAINVLDAAILVISAVERVEPQTKVIFDMLKRRGIPIFFFINKTDRIGADIDAAIVSIKQMLTGDVIPMVDEVGGDIVSIDDNVLIEYLANFDDNILIHYIENDDVDINIIHSGLAKGISDSLIYPIYAGSALKDIGLDLFISQLREYMPGKGVVQSDDGEFSAYVYMVRVIGGHREVYIKVLSGSLRPREITSYDGQDIKVHNISKVMGNDKYPADRIGEGEIAILHNINMRIGRIIGDADTEGRDFFQLNPMFRVDVLPVNNEFDRLYHGLNYLNDEDPLLNLNYNSDSKQFQIDLMGHLQGESIVALLKEAYDIDAVVSAPRIIYMETIKGTGLGECSYSGCSYVALRVRPGKPGSGIVVKSAISESVLYKKYQRQSIRLIHKYLVSGKLGWEITDIVVEIIDGVWDHLGSTQLHFNVAVPLALVRAIESAGSRLLEPRMAYSITFAEDYCNVVLSAIIGFKTAYSDIRMLANNRIEVTGYGTIQEVTELSGKLKRITNGNAMLEYHHDGYNPCADDVQIENTIKPDFYPFDQTIFMQAMGGSSVALDRIARL